MRLRGRALLVSLLLAGWCCTDAQAQWGWGAKERAANSLAALAGAQLKREQGQQQQQLPSPPSPQPSLQQQQQQPVTVSINPPRPAPTVLQPQPQRKPAPAAFALPGSNGDAGGLWGQGSSSAPASANSAVSSSSSSSGSSVSSSSGGSGFAPNQGRAAAGTAEGNPTTSNLWGSSASEGGVTEVITQPTGTTVKVLAGRPGPANMQQPQPQQVTIISIVPAAPAGGGFGFGQGPASNTGGWGLGTRPPQQQQQSAVGTVTLPAVDELLAEDLQQQTQAGGILEGQGSEVPAAPRLGNAGATLQPAFGVTGGAKVGSGSSSGSSSSSSSGAAAASKNQLHKQVPAMLPVGAPTTTELPQGGATQQSGAAKQWAKSRGGQAAANAHSESKAKACGCPSFNFNFACGADGLTYANPCMAGCAGVQVVHLGPCEVLDYLAMPVGSSPSGGSSSTGSSSSSTGSGGGSSMFVVQPGAVQTAPKPVDSSAPLAPEGDYEYYYDDGRPPVPAPPRKPGGVPIPVAPLPAPAPSSADSEEEQEEPPGAGSKPQPPPLPSVFGPEPIPEDEPGVPVPPPTPIRVTSPAPPKDTKGSTPRDPIPSVPVRAPPPAPAPGGLPGAQRPPLPGPPAVTARPGDASGGAEDDVGAADGTGLSQPRPQPQKQPQSALPKVAGRNAPQVQAPKPWVFKQDGAGESILIGCILPFEGDLQLAGNAVYHALKLAISEEAPKLLPDVNVNLTCINTKCADIPSHMAMMQLAQDNAVAVIGEICSAATVAAAGVSTSKKLPLISPAATSPALSDNDFFFRTVPSDKFQGQAAADLLIGKGYRNVAVVYEDAAYGYGLAFNFIAAFTKEGGNVPVVLMFPKGQGKPKQDALQVKADIPDKNLDAVFLSTNNLTYAAAFLKAAYNNNLGLRIFGGDALADTMMVPLLKDQPDALKNLSATTVNKGKNPFIRRFRAAFPDVPYASFAAQGYDAMLALLRAYAASPPVRDGPALAKELQLQKFEGVSGPIAFDKSGDVVPHDRTYMWVKHNTTTGVPMVKGYISRK